MKRRDTDRQPQTPAPDDQQDELFQVLPVGPQVGLTEVVRQAQRVDRRHPGWRPEVVWSQSAATIAEAEPGASLARFLDDQHAGHGAGPDQAMLIELIAACDRMTSHYAAMQAAFIQELMLHREDSLRSVTSVADEISARLAVTPYAGGAAVSRAMDLADSEPLRDGLSSGALSSRKVDVISDAAMYLDPQERVAITEYGCQIAPTHTPPQLKKALAAAVVAADPTRAEERHSIEVQQREVRFDPAPHGMAWLSVYTSAEDALAMYTCIDALAVHSDAADERGIDARRADAISAVFDSIMADGHLPGGAALPTRHGRKPYLQLSVTSPVLAGDAQTPALLHGYGPICAGTARALADQSTTSRSYQSPSSTTSRRSPLGDPMSEFIPPARPPDEPDGTEPEGLIQWVGDRAGTAADPALVTRIVEEELHLVVTDAYTPSVRLRALVVGRDQTCRFPTCQVPAWRCQLDHIQAFSAHLPAWAQTTEANLHALCTHHHQLKTSGDLIPERDPRTGVTTWRTRTGHLYSRLPEPRDYTALASHLDHARQLVLCDPGQWPTTP